MSIPHVIPNARSSTGSDGTASSSDMNDKLVTWWWWWEVTAMILSIACMSAFMVLLTKMNNIPLQSWWLPIQPNSVIAILTTVGKAALMVPAAACISQLKWRHFLLQPRTLADLQLFDEASRGPWGSALLLCRLCSSPQVFVALGFAFVITFAFGIDAAAQQVLITPSCRTNTTSTGMNCIYTTPNPPDGDGLPMTMEMHWDPENNGVWRAMVFQSAYNDTRDPETMPASLGTFMAIKTFTDGYTIYTDDGKEEPPATDIGLGETYNISRMAVESLPLYLKYVFTFTIYHDIYRPAKEYGETLQLGYTYYMGDTAAAFHNVSTTISNLMRSDLLGDSYNATAVQGTASFAETYIHVRWPWMILPLTEVLLAAVLLVISIAISHNHPLLKTSVIAYLASRLDGWTDEELDQRLTIAAKELDTIFMTTSRQVYEWYSGFYALSIRLHLAIYQDLGTYGRLMRHSPNSLVFNSLEALQGKSLRSQRSLRTLSDECQGRSGELAKDEKIKAPFAVDGHVITRGTQVGVKNFSLDHNENYFPEPFAFCRERWLVDDSEGSQKAKRVRGLFGRGAWGCRQGHGLSGVQYSGCEDAMVL
ncbi:hypothetical protein SCUP515_04987 [Seiridium cupressi]